MKEAFTPFLHLSNPPPKPNKFIMAGKMFNLFALLISLIGLALAQTQTTSMDSMASMEITSDSAATGTSTETPSTYTSDTTAEDTTTTEVITHPYNNQTTTPPQRTRETGKPTTTIPNPLMNTGRRVSQPGLGKLVVVVGLVTYGLILV